MVSARIDQAERGFRAGRGGVHRAHQHLLARAALTLDQYVAVAAGGLGRLGERGAEVGRVADHRVEIEHLAQLLGQRLKLVARRLPFGGAAQREHQPVGRDGLDQIVGRPGAHCLDREQRRGARGEHQDGEGRAARLEFLNQVARIVAGDPLVEDDRRQLHPLPRAEGGDGGFRVAHHQRAPALARGERGDQAALRRLIVDQHQQAVVAFDHGPRPVPKQTDLLRDRGKGPLKSPRLGYARA
jgi:hypothetical protein